MPASNESARTIIVTERAYAARCSAAWPGGVRAADEHHVLVAMAGGLRRGRAVGDAAADQLLDAGRVETAVGDAGGDHASRCAEAARRRSGTTRSCRRASARRG